MRSFAFTIAGLVWMASPAFSAAGPANVVVIVNEDSAASRSIAQYYASKRNIPASNICPIRAPELEVIDRETYRSKIEGPVGRCLKSRGLVERAYYLVTTLGVPLRIKPTTGQGRMESDGAAVDSELATLYSRLHGVIPQETGPLNNPFFARASAPFSHPEIPMYLVTRLAASDAATARALVDRALQARNTGTFVLDARGDDSSGDAWLKDAAIRLPTNRTVFDETSKVLYGIQNVIGFASWGSNDSNRTERFSKFRWLPGAIATEFVSSNGRTFQKAPDSFRISRKWDRQDQWFAGSPQSVITDYIAEGVTGIAGHVDEPFLSLTPRPDVLLPAWYSGRTLAEAFYLSLPAISWQNVIVGDPLCTLGPPPGK